MLGKEQTWRRIYSEVVFLTLHNLLIQLLFLEKIIGRDFKEPHVSQKLSEVSVLINTCFFQWAYLWRGTSQCPHKPIDLQIKSGPAQAKTTGQPLWDICFVFI